MVKTATPTGHGTDDNMDEQVDERQFTRSVDLTIEEGNHQKGSQHRQPSDYKNLDDKFAIRQAELENHINKVEENTLDINTTTAALKNRTEELAATQDEILRRIIALQDGKSPPKVGVRSSRDT